MKIRCSSLLFILVALLITVGCAHNKTIEGFNAIEWFEMGRQASIDNRLDKALDAFNKAIELDPKVAKAYVNRGGAYVKLGNYKQAIADYDKAIELTAEFALAYYNRGLAYSAFGNHNQAIADWKIAARLGLKEAQDYLKQQGIAW
jgi:tetratricopeptide (TPR) repeat protein